MSRHALEICLFSVSFLIIPAGPLTANPAGRVGVASLGGTSLGGGMGRIPGGAGGGIQLGAGSRGGIQFGIGGGGISIGVGGDRHPGRGTPNLNNLMRSWQRLDPDRHEYPDHGTDPPPDPWQPVPMPVEPIPQNPIPIPAVRNPVPTVTQTAQAEASVPANPLPVESAGKIVSAATAEPVNTLVVEGRQITGPEIDRAVTFFQDRLTALANNLEGKLPATHYDRDQLVELMIAKQVPPQAQIEIVDSLDAGDHQKAQRLWMKALPCCWVPFGPTPARDLLVKIRLAIARGSLTTETIRELADTMRYDTAQMAPPEAEDCCGADDLVYQLEQEVRIQLAITQSDGSRPTGSWQPNPYGKPDHFGKPSRDSVPTEMMPPAAAGQPGTQLAATATGSNNQPATADPTPSTDSNPRPASYGKWDPQGPSGQPVPIPTGPVQIIYHPQLPNRNVVVVDSQTVMVGTGGQGVFHMETGHVAEALGNRIADRPPLPHDPVEPARGGILIMNPTRTEVHFQIDGNAIELPPGCQKRIPGSDSKVIAFDRGKKDLVARYTLKPGTYRFLIDREGWNIARIQFAVVLSNQGNLDPFHYSVQDEQLHVEPESTNRHTDIYPIVIRFDRGNGSARKQIVFAEKQGTLQAAINPADNLWDLYDPPSTTNTLQSVLKKETRYVPAF